MWANGSMSSIAMARLWCSKFLNPPRQTDRWASENEHARGTLNFATQRRSLLGWPGDLPPKVSGLIKKGLHVGLLFPSIIFQTKYQFSRSKHATSSHRRLKCYSCTCKQSMPTDNQDSFVISQHWVLYVRELRVALYLIYWLLNVFQGLWHAT